MNILNKDGFNLMIWDTELIALVLISGFSQGELIISIILVIKSSFTAK